MSWQLEQLKSRFMADASLPEAPKRDKSEKQSPRTMVVEPNTEKIKKCLGRGEDSSLEFKQVQISGNKVGKQQTNAWADEIAAFANADGGSIIFGVDDSGNPQKLTHGQARSLVGLLDGIINDAVKPPIAAAIRIIDLNEECAGSEADVVLVQVPKGVQVHRSPGGYHQRRGSATRELQEEERLRLAQLRSQAGFLWFDKQPVPETALETLEQTLWQPLVDSEVASDNPARALGKVGMVRADKDGVLRATVAGILICTNKPKDWLPNAYVTATHYRGNDRASQQLDTQEISGPIDQQILQSVRFVERNMRVGAYKDPARMDLPQYSLRAVFEATANAVLHRDYSIKGSRIRLMMFSDRLEISSPGGLPNNLAVDAMRDRQATRNEVLASVLGRMPVRDGAPGAKDRRYFIEKRGDGVPIIERETKELCGQMPTYRLIDDAELCLTIPAALTESSQARVTITVRSSGKPLEGAHVLVLFPNKTWKESATDELGEATIELHTTQLPMTVFAAAEGCAAFLERDWTPAERALSVELSPLPGGGGTILHEGVGNIPGLSGRLNPIRDAYGRTYLYASNISVNSGANQPVYFSAGKPLDLADSNGRTRKVRILEVVGRTALVEYK